jgi:NAD+ synthase (glutamine-hydrolysing)
MNNTDLTSASFTPWLHPREYEEYHLPRMIQKLQGATHVIFGDAVISTPETCIGAETCVIA